MSKISLNQFMGEIVKKLEAKNEIITEATDAEVIDILSDMLFKLSDGNTTARQAAFDIAKERGVSFNLIIQSYQKKGGELQDIDFETLKEDSEGNDLDGCDKYAKQLENEIKSLKRTINDYKVEITYYRNTIKTK